MHPLNPFLPPIIGPGLPLPQQGPQQPPDDTQEPQAAPRPVTPQEALQRPGYALSHLTVYEQVVLQTGDGPTISESRFQRNIGGDNLPYPPPRKKIDTTPIPIDTGWLTGECGMLCLTNHGPGTILVIHTKLDYAILVIRPGESLRCEPAHMEQWRLRTVEGESTIKYTLFPSG